MQYDYEPTFVIIHSIPGKKSRSIVDAFLGVLFIVFLSAGVTSAEPFEPDKKSKLEAELTQVTATANSWAKRYEALDVTFKILLLMLGILSSVGAALAGTIWKNSTPPWLTISNVVVGAARARRFTGFRRSSTRSRPAGTPTAPNSRKRSRSRPRRSSATSITCVTR
jgi:Mn2+/Fe2+ NRAMP family transporter